MAPLALLDLHFDQLLVRTSSGEDSGAVDLCQLQIEFLVKPVFLDLVGLYGALVLEMHGTLLCNIKATRIKADTSAVKVLGVPLTIIGFVLRSGHVTSVTN